MQAALTKPGQGRAAGPDDITLCAVKTDDVSVTLLTGFIIFFIFYVHVTLMFCEHRDEV